MGGLLPGFGVGVDMLLERSVESSAEKKARTFGIGRTYRRQGERSSSQALGTGVVPAEGS